MSALNLITPPTAYVLTTEELKTHARIDIPDEDILVGDYVAVAHEWLEEVSGRAIVTQTFDWSFDRFLHPYAILRVPRPPLQQVLSMTYLDTAGVSQTIAAADYRVDSASEPGRITPAYNVQWPQTQPVVNAVTVQFVAGFVTPFVADPATDIVTASGRSFANDDQVRLSATSVGLLPAGLAAATVYHVVESAGTTFKLAATQGGAGVAITGAGSGTHFIGALPTWVRHAVRLLAASYYTTREDSTPREMRPIPLGVKSLLWANRVWA